MTRCLAQMAGSLLILLVSSQPSCACSVPVFRYALERWPSDPYRCVVFHRGPMTTSQQQLAADMGPDGLAGEKFANLVVRTVDLDAQPDEEMRALWKSQKNTMLPWMVVRYPDTVSYAPAWAGSLTESHVDLLIDSPVRRELAKRILAGETSAWILLESGNRIQDDAAFTRLQKQLTIEQSQLKLPDIDDSDLIGGDAKNEIAKLKVRFPIIRISRDDPKEKMLAAMLLGSEGSGRDSLRDPEYVNQPMAFPIFGRGRIRYGIVGEGIAEDTIHAACAYLVGPCKCQIKTGVENRGMDLVMAVDWNRLVVTTIRDKPAPPLQGLGTFRDLTPQNPAVAMKPRSLKPTPSPVTSAPQPMEETAAKATQPNKVSPAPTQTTAQPETEGNLSRNMFLMFALAGFVIAIATFAMFARKT